MFAHVQAMLSGGAPLKKDPMYVSQIWALRDEIDGHVRSLEALGVSGEKCELFHSPSILSQIFS